MVLWASRSVHWFISEKFTQENTTQDRSVAIFSLRNLISDASENVHQSKSSKSNKCEEKLFIKSHKHVILENLHEGITLITIKYLKAISDYEKKSTNKTYKNANLWMY